MKALFLGGFLTLAALTAGCTSKPSGQDSVAAVDRPAKADQADVGAVARGNNAFAFDLHRQMEGDGNRFFSPFSVSTALGMTYAGAKGGTAKDMARALHYPFEGERLHLGYASLLGKLSGDGKPAGVQLSVANALWGPNDYKKDFLDINRDYYAAHVRKINLPGAEPIINRWAEEHTAGRIKDLLPPNSLDNGILVLTNAVYFKGEWKYRFKASETRDEMFRVPGGQAVKVPMMSQTAELRYTTLHGRGNAAAAKILELPYKGGDLSMVVVLPDADDGIQAVERAMTADESEGSLNRIKMNKTKVRVRLPRFKIKGETVSLNDPLKRLGMAVAFNQGEADFSGMCGSPGMVYIESLFHQAFVEVNEEGSEAAAATAVIMADKDSKEGEKERLVEFTADHPFLFLIRDNRTGCLLFLGRLHAPK